jgi:hypothetical protein
MYILNNLHFVIGNQFVEDSTMYVQGLINHSISHFFLNLKNLIEI